MFGEWRKMVGTFAPALAMAGAILAAPTFAQRQAEVLDRGLVALPVPEGVFLSWRLLGTEPYGLGFNAYKGSTRLNSAPITGGTNYTDKSSGTGSYSVRAVLNGQEETAPGTEALAFPGAYLKIPLQQPAGGSFHGSSYTYTANDGSASDLDGDGRYDLILKWDPTNSKDNSQSGYTGPAQLDGITLAGKRLWRINLGPNIRAGAHYTQFLSADFDGDGKAEVACKTAPGTRDGTGAVLHTGPAAAADHAKEYVNSDGKVLQGPEWFTVFDGLTGKELATVDYVPGREAVNGWGGLGGNGGNDATGNRVDRFTACVAYLDGKLPSAVMGRGYYGRTALAAWDWRDGKLTQRWVFDTKDGTNPYSGQGAHGISVADVDDDGKDEIIFGAMTLDDDGRGLYTTGFRHGDALHVGDLDPARPGLEVYMIHENEGNATSSPGSEMHSARTGEVYWKTAVGQDVGRGLSADVDPARPGEEFWGTGSLLDKDGKNAGSSPGSTNFAVWWDGDLLRELEDGTTISKHGKGTLLSASGSASNNSTKSNPVLSADLLGDWREEVIWRSSDNTELRLYSTTIPTEYRLYTLMHDPVYRMAVAWQNVGYNQPPHPGFFLGEGMVFPPRKPSVSIKPFPSHRSPQRQPAAPNGGLFRTDGGAHLELPFGYRGTGQFIILRDAFGRMRAGGNPREGRLELDRDLPAGIYQLEAHTQR